MARQPTRHELSHEKMMQFYAESFGYVLKTERHKLTQEMYRNPDRCKEIQEQWKKKKQEV